MIRLRDVNLPQDTLEMLAKYQQDITKAGDYAAQVSIAEKEFKRRNTKTNKAFKVVRSHLTQMCSGARRCCYCQDSLAVQIEHIFPKSLYPDRLFDWENFLYACGRCNNQKNNNFAVFATVTGLKTEIARKKNDPVLLPILGTPLLINPRTENPFDFLFLDIIGKFEFTPLSDDTNSPEYQRAEYTIKTLRLNDLTAAREEAYDTYCDRLETYIARRNKGEDVERRIRAIKRIHHPSVWYAMKEFRDKIPELKALFDDAKEALDW
jgi:uncharacterized protein (TIGR02646 family)